MRRPECQGAALPSQWPAEQNCTSLKHWGMGPFTRRSPIPSFCGALTVPALWRVLRGRGAPGEASRVLTSGRFWSGEGPSNPTTGERGGRGARRDGQWAGQGKLHRGEGFRGGLEEQPSTDKAGTRGQQQGLPGPGRSGTKMRGGQHRAIHRKQTDLIGVQVRRRR